MNEEKDELLPGHIASDFYLWLWYRSETGGGHLDLGEGEEVDFWVDDRISFRTPGEQKVSAVMTGEHPGGSPEARAALAGGKVLRDVRLALKREDREYMVTLKGPLIEVSGAKLPGLVKTGDTAEILYERMFLYEELGLMLRGLFRRFAELRTSDQWDRGVMPQLTAWAHGQAEVEPPEDA
ncbi:MAG TPA: hypothetical protein PKY30_07850 [Myxococcota bacterium]|nr:hypothetical protein [Myxococcota bacterium]HND29862.1 hypothetical protein [Myxococcota bacterium]HNH46934.1 hypothetical protein [Myxococcota bacterium]